MEHVLFSVLLMCTATQEHKNVCQVVVSQNAQQQLTANSDKFVQVGVHVLHKLVHIHKIVQVHKCVYLATV